MNSTSWINLALSNDEDRKALIVPHGGIASDGTRMHIDENALHECKCGDDKTHQSFKTIIAKAFKQTKFSFTINPKYLIDALRGFEDKVNIFVSADSKMIVLQDDFGFRSAIVLGIYNESPEKPFINNALKDFIQEKHDADVKTVCIPSCEQHEGLYASTVKLQWTCPTCGAPRGEIYETISFDGSRRLGVNGWRNPCGHVDHYGDVRKEAQANGLNNHQEEKQS